MNEPWFRRYAMLGRYPIHWKGAVFGIALLALEVVIGRASPEMIRSHSPLSMLAAAAFVVVAFGGLAIVERKTEKSYRRE